VELRINGKVVTAEADPNMPLLWVLRDVLNMTGTKFGCGVAACGACTVRVDGQAIRSCVTPVSTVVGKRIQTIEALNLILCRQPGSPNKCPNAATVRAACSWRRRHCWKKSRSRPTPTSTRQ